MSEKVESRILSCNDLVAPRAQPHFNCRKSFKKHSTSNLTHGRPKNNERLNNFIEVCKWLESEAEVYSLQEIYRKMVDLSGSEENVYSQKWLKTKLKEKYGTYIQFFEDDGNVTKVCFKNMIDYLIKDKWYTNREANSQDEADKIISLAAKLVLHDIRSEIYNCNSYPTKDVINNAECIKRWVPAKLMLLLEGLIKNPIKQASIGQALVHAARPRSCIPPTMFGLSVEVDHLFGSRWLIEQLNHLGFGVSIDEVTRFKQSVLENDSIELDIARIPGSFTQWSADNVDHNVRTIDGKGLLHGMGIIASTTNKDRALMKMNVTPVKRQKLKKVTDLIRYKGIEI